MRNSFQKEYEAKLDAQIDFALDQIYRKDNDTLTKNYYRGVLLGLRIARSLFCMMIKERIKK